MNVLDAYVREVLSEPVKDEYGWYVRVSYTCWSPVLEYRKLYFSTEEDARKVKEGYKFLT